MTKRLCKICDGWHDLDMPWPSNCYTPKTFTRSELPSPGIIFDTMGAVRSMTDGQMYDSKSALRKQYKQAGVVEVGNDPSVTNPKPFKRPKVDRKAISDTVDKAFSRAGFGT
jgi:hypothetical protein